MAVSLKHTFQSTVPDGGDTSLVRPSDWNAEHTLTLDTGKLIGRSTAGAGAAEEISIGTGLSLSGGTLSNTQSTTLTPGTTATSGGAAGQIMFDTGSVLQESSNFVWNNANGGLTVSSIANPTIPSLTINGASNFTGAALSGVQITGTGGQFSCNATTLVVGEFVTISGTLGGTGSISGYANPTTYRISATNGTTTFTLVNSTTGAALTTTSGTPTGLTYTVTDPFINLSQTWNNSNVAFRGLQYNVTDTASNANSLLMNLQVGSSTKFSVNRNGMVFLGGAITNGIGGTGYGVVATNNFILGTNLATASNRSGLFLAYTAIIAWASTSPDFDPPDLLLTRRGAANLRFGAADAAAPVAQTLSVQSVVAGTSNTAGANLTITGSQGTGTGAGGSIIFQVAPAGTTGTAQNALSTALTIASDRKAYFSLGAQVSAGQYSAGNGLDFGGNGTGLYSVANNILYVVINSNANIQFGGGTSNSAVQLQTGGYFGWGNMGSAPDTILTRRGAANVRLGLADAAAPVAQTLSVQSVVAGTTDTAGANLTITGSQGTGTGAGGSIIFQTAPAGTTGTAQNALTTALTINSSQQLVAANGTAAAPQYSFTGQTGSGLALITSNLTVYNATLPMLRFAGNTSRFNGSSGYTVSFSSGDPTSTSSDVFLSRRAAANLQLGAADAAAPVAQTLSVQSVVAGTSNTAGANFTITGSQGTGTGAGGSIIFQVAPAGSSGTAQNALADAFTIASSRTATFTSSAGTTSILGNQISGNAGAGLCLINLGSNNTSFGGNGVYTFTNAENASVPGIFIAANRVLGWNSNNASSGGYNSGDTILRRRGSANIQFGNADAAAPVAQTLSVQSVVAGTTDTAGANLTITGSQSTGTGAAGNIIFQTSSSAASTGTAQNALATVATIGPNTLTGSQATSLLDLAQTWNTTGTPTALKLNVTDTASNVSSLLMDLQVGGVSQFRVRKDGVSFVGLQYRSPNGSSFGDTALALVSTTANINWNADTYITRRGAANLRFGAADAAAPVAQTLSVQSVVAGTSNTAGANLTITGSQGTGTGAGGSIIFQVAPAGSTGTAQNALATALTIGSNRNTTFSGQLISTASTNGGVWVGPNTTQGTEVLGDSIIINNGGNLTASINRSAVKGFSTTWDGVFTWGTSTTNANGFGADLFLTRRGAANLRFGAADAAAPVAQTLSVQSVVAGTSNTAGANFTITGSQGTGTGAGGDIIFQTADVGASGTAQNTLTTALRIYSNQTVAVGKAYTVATLPAAGTQGRRAWVTDATAPTFLGALTGGGAVVCPVFDNGTAWVAG